MVSVALHSDKAKCADCPKRFLRHFLCRFEKRALKDPMYRNRGHTLPRVKQRVRHSNSNWRVVHSERRERSDDSVSELSR